MSSVYNPKRYKNTCNLVTSFFFTFIFAFESSIPSSLSMTFLFLGFLGFVISNPFFIKKHGGDYGKQTYFGR